MPPYPGIGGRRWVKFAKYLDKRDWEVHTLAAVNPMNYSSDWQHEYFSTKIQQHSLNYKYPKVFSAPINSIWDRLTYRITHKYFTLFSAKRVFDSTFLSEKIFKNKVKKLLHKYDIKNVIITSPPYYYLSYLADLKNEMDFNFIVDFRDPWLGAKNFGLINLSGQRLLEEKKYVKNVFDKANSILSPSMLLLERLAKHINTTSDKCIELKHAYDEDDFKDIIFNKFYPKNKIVLVYGGSLYQGTEKIVNGLLKTLDYINKYNKNLYRRLDIRFFTPENHISKRFKYHMNIVSFSTPIGKKIFEDLNNCTFPIILLAEHNKDYRTTKYYEYLLLRKPYLLFSPKGVTSKYTTKNRLGIWIDSEKPFTDKLEQVLMNIDYVYSKFNYEFYLEKHSYNQRTLDLETLLEDK